MKIIFLRHGQDDEDFRGGWSSLGLLEEGKRQAACVARYFREQSDCRIETILSSDLNRAMETAAYCAGALGLPVEKEPGLREINNGDLAGMGNEEALTKYPGLFFSSLEMEEAYPGGESPGAFYRRIQAWFGAFLGQCRSYPGDVLVVTHGGVIQVICHLVQGLEWTNRKKRFPVGKCSIHVLDVDTMEFEVENRIVW